jgi:hypothetical protein
MQEAAITTRGWGTVLFQSLPRRGEGFAGDGESIGPAIDVYRT